MLKKWLTISRGAEPYARKANFAKPDEYDIIMLKMRFYNKLLESLF